ncbi:nuclear transport factor 2 family protein [Catenuloplanes japonicus]|uniref:nuclear transport factor 2 family protein n=1 Tax=Catenuloplanes japonicus TaxID=33876 RepID=UPI0005251036|nr:nuclear transport factor 2 family protein [Catenuloplanes japonicus]
MIDDRTAIADVLHRMAWCQDRSDWEALSGLLADRIDVTHETTPDALSRTVDRDSLIGRWRDGLDGTTSQHILTGIVTDLDGDRAEVMFNETVWVARPGVPGAPLYHFGVAMHATLRRTDRWRVTALRLTPIWSDGNTAVLRGSAALLHTRSEETA